MFLNLGKLKLDLCQILVRVGFNGCCRPNLPPQLDKLPVIQERGTVFTNHPFLLLASALCQVPWLE